MDIMLDTNVVIAYMRDEEGKSAVDRLFAALKEGRYRPLISVLTVTELVVNFARRGELKRAAETIIFLKELGFQVIPVSEAVAKRAGLLKAKYASGKEGFSVADALILATAIEAHTNAIITYDTEFAKVVELPVKRPEELF